MATELTDDSALQLFDCLGNVVIHFFSIEEARKEELQGTDVELE